jgi:hypothetical protein
VYNGDKKEFVSCGHNFRKVKCVNFIRLYNEKNKDYPAAEILRRSDKIFCYFQLIR